MHIQRVDHFTIVTDRLADSVEFYARLGLRSGPRPDFATGGAWLYAGDRPVLHLLQVLKMPEPRRGALDHMAFWAAGLLATACMLDELGVRHRIVRAPKPYGTWQLFCEDPNGVEVELDFDPAETAPDDWRVRGKLA